MLTRTEHPYRGPTHRQAGAAPINWAAGGETAGDSDVSLAQLLSLLRRRLPTMAAVAGSILALVTILTFTAQPVFSSKASILVDDRRKIIVTPDVLPGLGDNTAAVDTEAQVLRSRELADRVIKAVGLETIPEFNPNVGKKPGLRPGGEGGVDAQTRAQMEREEIIDRVLENVTVRRVGDTYVIDVVASSKSPLLSAKLANTYVDEYINSQLDAKYQAVAKANTFLGSQLKTMREEVRTKETAVEEYRAVSGQSGPAGGTASDQQVSSLIAQLAVLSADLAEKEARWSSARNISARGGSLEALPEALRSDNMRAYRAQQTDLARRRADLATRYGPAHPEMLKLERETNDLDAQIKGEMSRIVASLDSEVDIARSRVSAVQGALGRARGELANQTRGSAKLADLEREAQAARIQYENYLSRSRELTVADDLQQADARVIARATPPLHPTSPNKPLNLAAGFALALLSALAAAIVMEMLERGVRTSVEGERKLGLQSMASIPVLDRKALMVDGERLEPSDFVLRRPLSAFAEAFRNLRANLFISDGDHQVKIAAITSALPNEGKTTAATCLARVASLAGSKTILLDCDLRRAKATAAMRLEPKVGLMEVLFSGAALNEAIITDETTGLDILPLARVEFTLHDVFSSPEMKRLLDDLRARYDAVIIDTPPILPVADTRVLTALADATVMVVRWRSTPIGAVQAALDIMRNLNANIVGFALQAVDVKKAALMGDERDAVTYYGSYGQYYVQ